MSGQELSVSAIKTGLTTRTIGQNIVYYSRVSSTMEIASNEARRGITDGTVIIAGEQTAGRGRLKRAWFAPGGNIALSLVLYPDAAGLPYLIMITSLAAAYAIESVTGLKTQIKWPNDILLRGKKVAGILIENQLKGSKPVYAVIGIGINVALQPATIKEISNIATSLENELGKQVSREEIIRNFLTEFDRLYLKLPDAEEIFKKWRERLITLGEKVTATWGAENISGMAEAVDETGALIIRLADGTLTKVVAGDVTLREK
jgi:BirA family transcriptional regulator, biotin operon repressor / biotin---[acetyl-CoA-carboxylase] ligase